MEKRIIIKSIKIKNFRSIRNETIDVKNMNIFVGQNDVGKSNFLKALNLFFTGETDYGVPFDFKRDFSNLFPKKSHQTKEIVIEIKLDIPTTYKENGIFTWIKIWRANDYVREIILNEKGEKPSDRSRVPGTLKRIKYRYVPAVKSREYYKSLLSILYFTVSAVLDSPLEESVEQFSNVLQEYTAEIGRQVNQRVGIESKLSIPENLSELFRTLVFLTNSSDDERKIPLDMRGDGIQARHIPIILKYIAEEDKKTRNQGAAQVITIWGYEEPENGVEIAKAFNMAKDFNDFSNEIQMFITTHSPAFYMQKVDKNTAVFYVNYNSESEGTKLKQEVDGLSIGQSMGLMPIVAPYIAEQEALMTKVKKINDENILYDIPTIMVEGKTDKEYVELAIKLFSPKLYQKIKDNELRVFTKDGEGGCKKLEQWVFAWIFSGNSSKAVAVYDKDEAGRKAKDELTNHPIFEKKRASAAVSVKYLEPSEQIINLMRKHLDVYYEIEHLLSVDCWELLKEKDLVELRTDEELHGMVRKIITRDKTVDNILDEVVEDINLLGTIVTLNPHKDKKEKICQLVEKADEEKQREYLAGLRKSIEMFEKIFNV